VNLPQQGWVNLAKRYRNILERITFYDIDSTQVEKNLTVDEKRLYVREIKKDITYFRKPYERADLRVDISGLDFKQAARFVKEAVEALERSRKKEQKSAEID
jgi:shikimate kinase